MEPVKVHVHSFCLLGLDFVVDDCLGRGVVCLDGRPRLFVAELVKDLSDVDCLLGCNVEGAEFCFGGGGHDVFDDLGDCENDIVVRRVYSVVKEEEMSPGTAARSGLAVVARIAVHHQYHVTC